MPRRAIDLTPEAEAEAREAFAWYRKRDSAVAERFEIGRALERIAEMPEQGPEVDVGIRRVLLESLPQGVLYAIDVDRIRVAAFMHLR